MSTRTKPLPLLLRPRRGRGSERGHDLDRPKLDGLLATWQGLPDPSTSAQSFLSAEQMNGHCHVVISVMAMTIVFRRVLRCRPWPGWQRKLSAWVASGQSAGHIGSTWSRQTRFPILRFAARTPNGRSEAGDDLGSTKADIAEDSLPQEPSSIASSRRRPRAAHPVCPPRDPLSRTGDDRKWRQSQATPAGFRSQVVSCVSAGSSLGSWWQPVTTGAGSPFVGDAVTFNVVQTRGSVPSRGGYWRG
jgi:hypothetical protein